MQLSIVVTALVLIGAEDLRVEAPVPSDPRAEVLLRSAQYLDRAGKPEGAIAFYRQLVREFWGSDEAAFAAGRIVALGGRVPARSEAIPPKRADTYRPPIRRRSAVQQEQVINRAEAAVLGQINYGFPRAVSPIGGIRDPRPPVSPLSLGDSGGIGGIRDPRPPAFPPIPGL